MPFIPSGSGDSLNVETSAQNIPIQTSSGFMPTVEADTDESVKNKGIVSRINDYALYATLGPLGVAAKRAAPVIGGTAKAIAEPFVKTAVTGTVAGVAAAELGQEKLFGIKGGQERAERLLEQGLNLPVFGQVTPARIGTDVEKQMQEGAMPFGAETAKTIGTGVQIGVTLGGGNLSSLIPNVGKVAAIKAGAAVGRLTGGLYGFGSGLRGIEEGTTKEQATFDVIGSTLGGAFIGNMVGGALAGIAAKTSPTETQFVKNIRAKITRQDPTITTLIDEKQSPEAAKIILEKQQRYLADAIKARNPRYQTPLEKAAEKAEKAFTYYEDVMKKSGTEKTAIMRGPIGKIRYEGADKIKSNLDEQLADRFGLQIIKGEIKPIQGREINIPKSDQQLLLSLYKDVKRSTSGMRTLQMMDDTVDLLQRKLYGAKRNVFRPISSEVESLFKQTTGIINNQIKDQAGIPYTNANARYSNAIEMRDWLNTNLGESGQKGAGLMKKLFGPAGGDAREKFEIIRKATGIDLVEEGSLAKWAMETVGDVRQRSLLEAIKLLESGPAGKEISMQIMSEKAANQAGKAVFSGLSLLASGAVGGALLSRFFR